MQPRRKPWSTRLARLPDRQVDHDNPDGGSGCHRQHRHPQFAVPHSLRQLPAGPCLCGPAGGTGFLWHALLTMRHGVGSGRCPLPQCHGAPAQRPVGDNPSPMSCPGSATCVPAHGTRGSMGRRRDRHTAKFDLLTGGRSRTRRIGDLSIDMQEITITKIHSKFQGQLSFGVRYV